MTETSTGKPFACIGVHNGVLACSTPYHCPECWKANGFPTRASTEPAAAPASTAAATDLAPTAERIEETLFRVLHNEGDGGIWESFDAKNARLVAQALVPTVQQMAQQMVAASNTTDAAGPLPDHERFPFTTPAESEARMFIQWKGTDACLDFYCVCGAHCHVDDMFAYYVKCPHCESVYEMGAQVIAKRVSFLSASPVIMDRDDRLPVAGEDTTDV
jgi:hypothetical protein